MRHLLILLLLIPFGIKCRAQIVNYAYDASGNRTSRTVTFSKSLLEKSDSSQYEKQEIIEQLGERSITVYPNPVSEEVNVEISGYDENMVGSITIFDQSGRLIISQPQISIRNSFNMSRYSKGIYFMVIRIGENQTKYTIIRN